MKEKINNISHKTDINKRTQWSKEMEDKYNHSGCYAIYINKHLVYIGKSVNMKHRLVQHMGYIKTPKNCSSRSGRHKYHILREAYDTGCLISFDVIYYGEDIDAVEEKLIKQYLPPLNYAVSKNVKNNVALKISLNEILNQPKVEIESAVSR